MIENNLKKIIDVCHSNAPLLVVAYIDYNNSLDSKDQKNIPITVYTKTISLTPILYKSENDIYHQVIKQLVDFGFKTSMDIKERIGLNISIDTMSFKSIILSIFNASMIIQRYSLFGRATNCILSKNIYDYLVKEKIENPEKSQDILHDEEIENISDHIKKIGSLYDISVIVDDELEDNTICVYRTKENEPGLSFCLYKKQDRQEGLLVSSAIVEKGHFPESFFYSFSL